MKRFLLLVTALLVGCADDNAEPKFSKETGLPVNCRAYVQTAVDSYRSRAYPADEIFNGLERNCGANGISWKPSR